MLNFVTNLHRGDIFFYHGSGKIFTLILFVSHRYTNIAWDILHHAGASQIHPHFHMMMAPDHYYGSFELLRSAAQRYYDLNKENYFTTLLEIHAALGLVVEYGDAVAVATLVSFFLFFISYGDFSYCEICNKSMVN